MFLLNLAYLNSPKNNNNRKYSAQRGKGLYYKSCVLKCKQLNPVPCGVGRTALTDYACWVLNLFCYCAAIKTQTHTHTHPMEVCSLRLRHNYRAVSGAQVCDCSADLDQRALFIWPKSLGSQLSLALPPSRSDSGAAGSLHFTCCRHGEPTLHPRSFPPALKQLRCCNTNSLHAVCCLIPRCWWRKWRWICICAFRSQTERHFGPTIVWYIQYTLSYCLNRYLCLAVIYF